MVVSGAPEITVYHALNICNMALDMIASMVELSDPSTGGHMRIRVGKKNLNSLTNLVALFSVFTWKKRLHKIWINLSEFTFNTLKLKVPWRWTFLIQSLALLCLAFKEHYYPTCFLRQSIANPIGGFFFNKNQHCILINCREIYKYWKKDVTGAMLPSIICCFPTLENNLQSHDAFYPITFLNWIRSNTVHWFIFILTIGV